MEPTDPIPPVSDGPPAPSPAPGRRPLDQELQKAIDAHSAAVYRIALAIVRDPALADDVVQETMIKAWRSSPVAPGEALPRAWLLKVARNTAISLLRTRREELRGPETLPDGDAGPGPGRTVESRAALKELWSVLHRLDEDARTLVIMREIDGMSYEEMASALDVPLSSVKTRLFRARRALKDAMEAWR